MNMQRKPRPLSAIAHRVVQNVANVKAAGLDWEVKRRLDDFSVRLVAREFSDGRWNAH
jgi:hypothetical protein